MAWGSVGSSGDHPATQIPAEHWCFQWWWREESRVHVSMSPTSKYLAGKAAPSHSGLCVFPRERACSLHLSPVCRAAAPSSHHTFSRKLLFLAALARPALAALHTLGVPSSWSSAQALNVWGRGWSWPSCFFPCSFLIVLACPVHFSSSTSVTRRDRRSGPRVPC